jgi:uncharacterized repeat protein (TIGR03803 family)
MKALRATCRRYLAISTLAFISDCLLCTATYAQTVDVLHGFSGGDGASPEGAPIQAADGSLYGTTMNGGSTGLGTVFRVAPDGSFTTLHTFVGGSADGATPLAGLLQATDGNFYGTTYRGGAFNEGTVFAMSPSGFVTVLHSFAAGSDGDLPSAALIQATDGSLYGTTVGGGSSNLGTVFRITTGGMFAVVYSFTGGANDGALPSGGVIQATDGNFYGANGGGVAGTIYRMTPAGAVTVLHAFSGGLDGNGPGPVMQGVDGMLYGTTVSGGASRLGVLFTMNLDGTFSILHSFAGVPDGAYPQSGLTQASNGDLYGATWAGGASFECCSTTGTLYRVHLDGAYEVVHVFGGFIDGAGPLAALTEGLDGNLYGTGHRGRAVSSDSAQSRVRGRVGQEK